jgi:hypothetical protein
MYNKMKKSIIIKEEAHTQLKKYCDENGLKLQKFVENLILKNIKDGKHNMGEELPPMPKISNI